MEHLLKILLTIIYILSKVLHRCFLRPNAAVSEVDLLVNLILDWLGVLIVHVLELFSYFQKLLLSYYTLLELFPLALLPQLCGVVPNNLFHLEVIPL